MPSCQVCLTDGVTGDMVRSFTINGDPYDICVSDKKDDGYSKHEVCGVAVLG